MFVKLNRRRFEELMLLSGLKENGILSVWNGLKELASQERVSLIAVYCFQIGNL